MADDRWPAPIEAAAPTIAATASRAPTGAGIAASPREVSMSRNPKIGAPKRTRHRSARRSTRTNVAV
jgi:hypothetical protein